MTRDTEGMILFTMFSMLILGSIGMAGYGFVIWDIALHMKLFIGAGVSLFLALAILLVLWVISL